LDALLADRNSLNTQVLTIVAEKAAVYGIELKTVGARDIVLRGEMKAILTQVVETKKLVEANLIKRQEKTQATRSFHNTTKVMEGNPVLLRLKELEILEKSPAVSIR
jgi:regulator of protease activity HflC (stomatin/prohibitin superfamily)